MAASVPGVRGEVRAGVPHRFGINASSHWFRVALCVLGLATAPLIALPVARLGSGDLDTTLALMVLVAWSCGASGYVAWERRAENRLGALLRLLGHWGTAGHLMQ